MPNDDPRLRASDDDRDRTASLLREHHAAGRLTVEEFQERLDAAYEAKTLGQLQELLADLPSIDLYHLPEQSMRRSQMGGSQPLQPKDEHGRLSPIWRHHWGSWASVSMLLFAIWLVSAITSHSVAGLWFLWVSVPWGAILLSRWMFGQHPDGGHGPHRLQAGQVHGIDAPGEQADHMGQVFDAGGQGPDDQMQRQQEQMQDHMRRHQEQMADRMRRRQEQMAERMQRRQDRLQRRQGPMQPRQDRPGED
jgi:exonuclease VII large subunit